jgi:hypothetical protein
MTLFSTSDLSLGCRIIPKNSKILSSLHARSGPWGEIPFLLFLSCVIPVGAARH